MPRKTNRTVILAKIEATAGTDAAPAAADALLIGDNSFDVEYKNVDRNLIRPTMGHGGTLVGTRNVKIDITIELSTSGTAGTAPPWGKLLLACAFAEVVTAATMVEYTPVSDGLKTLTIKYSKDGVIHTALGCVGTVSFEEPEGDRPTLKFSFVGIDGGSVAAATPANDLTAWQLPEVVNNINTGKLTLGAAYAAGAITGGTEYCSRGLSLDMANDAKYIAMLGCASVDITDRKPTGKFSIEVTGAQEVAMRAAINASTPTAVSLLHGSGAGKRVLIHVPRAVRLNPKYDEYEGTLLLSNDFNAEPIVGNDEVRIVVL
jgi:hypothetical protein